MSLRSMKKVTRKSWDMILMPDTVISQVNILGKDQPYMLIFTDCKGLLIGDSDVEITGLGGDWDKNEAPIKIEK